MIGRVWVVLNTGDGDERPLGLMDFASMPQRRELIVVPNDMGGLDRVEVAYVVHDPIPSEPKTPEEAIGRTSPPTVTIYVTMAEQNIDV